jgi:predicted transcriptional regulator
MKNENLIQWLTAEKSAVYFGKSFAIRADVLAQILTGTGTLADIARHHGVSRQAVQKHAKQARRIYFEPPGNGQPPVDCFATLK